MAENRQMKARVVQKTDIEANWNNIPDFIPLLGEFIIYQAEEEGNPLPEGRTEYFRYMRLKIGDGKTRLKDLPFSLALSSIDEIDSLFQ